MGDPCEQAGEIKYMKRKQDALQKDIKEAFGEIKDSVKLFQIGQEKMTKVLVDMAKNHQQLLSVADKTDENRKDIDSLAGRVREDVGKLHDRINNIAPVKNATRGFDKTQFSLIIGAITGFLTFLYTLIGKLIDALLTSPPPG